MVRPSVQNPPRYMCIDNKKNRWLEMFRYTSISKDFGNSLIQSH